MLEQIVAVDDRLDTRPPGSIYFPFTRYGADRPEADQEVRAAQAYFVKFPVQLFDVIPGIASARIDGPLDPVDVALPEDFQPIGKKAPRGRTTRAQDPALRDAVERRALDVAKAYYQDELSCSDYEEVGKPYDIKATVHGVQRRCEVKGSSMEIDTVELTVNEVEHGTAYTSVDLIVVDRITPMRDPETGEVTGAVGGRRRIWLDWSPAQTDLRATKFAYALPPRAAS